MLKQTLSQKLLQKLSPQQIQFIKLLELNTLNFEEKVQEELMENPALETGKEDERDDRDESDDRIESDERQDDDFAEDFYDTFSSREDDFDITDYINEAEGGLNLSNDYGGEEEEREPIPITNTVSFRDVLFEQVVSYLHGPDEERLADQLIGTIENDGYIRRPLNAIVNDLLFSANIRTTEAELERILRIIQEQDPPGIGARSLQECLLLQIDRKAKTKNTPILRLAREIVANYMEDFSKKHYSQLINKLEVEEDYLKEAIELITKLNPKPAASGLDSVKAEYIIPDFIVKERDGELEVSLNSRNAPELKVSRDYIETLKGYDEAKKPNKEVKDAVQFIRQKLDSAKWFIDSIQQRQRTLMLTMQAIVDIQHEYFLTGDEANLKPMILKDIAERVSLDISTISRVASSKYVETDFGIFLLKHFFSEGIQTDSGEEVSNKEVKMILQGAIGRENKKKPLTDGQLMDILKEKGYPIARRTVAKYREQLNIPVARLRKEL